MSVSMSGVGAGAPQVWSGASVRMPPQQKMANLFDKIDTVGSGSITETQLAQAFSSMRPPAGFRAMGSDALFAKLDPKGTGSVSKADFVQTMTSMMAQLRQAHATGGPSADAAASLGSSTSAMTSSSRPWTGTLVNRAA